MLRVLFNEPKRTMKDGQRQVTEQLNRFIGGLSDGTFRAAKSEQKLAQYAIWSRGFQVGLDELEQSVYCSVRYAESIKSSFVEDMEEGEHDEYRRFVYFYKNGLIRVFSLLDKLGYFLDDWLQLQTEQVKPHFSFFTVLRRMYERHAVPQLQQQLYELKAAHKQSLTNLRKQRNMEIHYVNAEMLDDWKLNAYRPGDKFAVENVRFEAQELSDAYAMVEGCLLAVFRYLNETAEEKQQRK
ncbi:Cthe_2314 family HEPN domain-containing protein [Paenibacillus chartarius]|uniref:Cthe_2314 family HEPN domain-containing protein n=1 Tax=Paenibacillus chartarius TaxID=747481 RepID=A0ABV6DFA7_9BACL